MRLWHLAFGVILLALILTLVRDEVGCVAVIVFFTGLGEVVLGTAAVLALFQTLGALGEARGLGDHAEALAATSVVLGLSSGLMTGWLYVGAWLVRAAVA